MIYIKGVQDNLLMEIGDYVRSYYKNGKYSDMRGVIIDIHGDRYTHINNILYNIGNYSYFGYSVKWENGEISSWAYGDFIYDIARERNRKIEKLLT